MSNKPSEFDFCPKCGAVARNGQCPSCGSQRKGGVAQKSQKLNEKVQNKIKGIPVKLTIFIFILSILRMVISNENEKIRAVDNVEVVETVDELQIENYDYLVEIDDFVNEDVSYKITEDYIFYESQAGNVYLNASFYQLEGDIPNIDAINLEIFEASTYLANQYLDEFENDDDSFSGEYYADVISYITYNDENTISIVLEEYYKIDDSFYVDLYSMNYNLITGTRIANSEILNVDEKLAREFRDTSNIQNGQSYAVDSLSDLDLVDFITDDTCNIVFYSPKGVEIGFNYIYGETDSGWITATIINYDNYLK